MRRQEGALIKPKQFPSIPKEGCPSPGVEHKGRKESFTPSMNLIPWRGRPWWSRKMLAWHSSCYL